MGKIYLHLLTYLIIHSGKLYLLIVGEVVNYLASTTGEEMCLGSSFPFL